MYEMKFSISPRDFSFNSFRVFSFQRERVDLSVFSFSLSFRFTRKRSKILALFSRYIILLSLKESQKEKKKEGIEGTTRECSKKFSMNLRGRIDEEKQWSRGTWFRDQVNNIVPAKKLYRKTDPLPPCSPSPPSDYAKTSINAFVRIPPSPNRSSTLVSSRNSYLNLQPKPGRPFYRSLASFPKLVRKHPRSSIQWMSSLQDISKIWELGEGRPLESLTIGP